MLRLSGYRLLNALAFQVSSKIPPTVGVREPLLNLKVALLFPKNLSVPLLFALLHIHTAETPGEYLEKPNG